MEVPKFKLTPREYNSATTELNNSLPRPEYKEGKIKLQFKHQFSTGEILRLQEDEKGNVVAVLERDQKIIFDFKKLFEGSFVTPTSIKKRTEGGFWTEEEIRKFSGEWSSEVTDNTKESLVSIGDVRSPRDIFRLLHEIGHTFLASEEKRQLHRKNIVNHPFLPGFSKKKSNIDLIINDSTIERNAWAWALKTARKIHKQSGVNIFEVFGNRADFENMLYGCLLTYRMEKNGELANSMKEKWSFWNWKPKQEDINILKVLFDNERLQRPKDPKIQEQIV